MIAMIANGAAVAAPPAAAPGGELLGQIGISPKLGQQLPLDLEFTDSTGKPVRLRDCFNGNPVVLHLVYYECPMLCKLTSDGLFDTLDNLSLKPGDDFSIVTLSFDPREGPELSTRARQLAIERCGELAVESGWQFLTGGEQNIDTLTQTVGFRYAFDEQTKQYAHAAGLFIVTPDGTVSRFLSGIQYSPRDLRLALVEAGGGKVGTTTDQMLLLCYMYDPTKGKYGLAIMTAVRVGGLATVGVMAIAIVTMLRRERWQKSTPEMTNREAPSSSRRG